MNPTAARALAAFALIALAACATPSSTPDVAKTPASAIPGMPPPAIAPVGTTVDVLHGVSIPDPYRSLEDLKSPQTQAWLADQGRYASAVLARIAVREELLARIAELSRSGGDRIRSVTRMPNEMLFYMERKAGEPQAKLMLRAGAKASPRVLVDPFAQTQDGTPQAINWYRPSWDGKTIAYGISQGGSENASMHLMDVASGRELRAPVPRVLEAANWAPDNRTVVFNQLRELPADAPDSEFYMDSTVYRLAINDAGAEPQPLFGPLVNPKLELQRLDVGSVQFDPNSRWMLARTTDTTHPEGKLFIAPIAALRAKDPATIAWQRIATTSDGIVDATLVRDRLYLRTFSEAPHGRVLALELASRPSLKSARTIVAEPREGAIDGFVVGSDALYAMVRGAFTTRTLRYPLNGSNSTVDVAPGVAGGAIAQDDPAHAYSDALLFATSWTAPPRYLRTQPRNAKAPVVDAGLPNPPPLPAGLPELEVTEVRVPSHDGVLVPLAIVRKKGLVLDGTAPTILDGYGAYGISTDAFFATELYAWFERGGVLAYANVRGSGALGEDWHLAGFKATKPNTWKDGIACAQYLIDQHYASPATLAVWGTSAGGIFVGRAVTDAPQLFAAAIFEVGMLDPLRGEGTANGITNVSEFGTVNDPAEFQALLEMSTYQHVVPGTAYPGVLLIHGMNDPRVAVWESAKTAARLQAASSSGRPVLLRLDTQAGHGIGSTATQRQAVVADAWAFLLWQMGKTSLTPPAPSARP